MINVGCILKAEIIPHITYYFVNIISLALYYLTNINFNDAIGQLDI